jgi:bla regulator protein BlaR1
MDLSFMQNDLVLALCWTLIHSVWQGLLLAIITGVVLVSTRKSNAKKRYRILTSLFFLFMLVTVGSFVREFNLVNNHSSAIVLSNSITGNQPLVNVTGAANLDGVVASNSFLDRFKDYFNTHASLIVLIWFVIFIARLIKLTADLAYVQRLKNYKTYSPSQKWKDKIEELVLKLGIRKKIQLLESGIVKVPVVMGVLKPVILLPIGLLAHLPADEIEAILLHELAHIQRKDYFMNLLQSFAETLFFFNPALMWLSSMIREERENCCDDIAISVTNNKTKFINALIAFQEYNFSTNSYAMGFPGKKNQLLNRVKRIISDRNKTLNTMEKSLLTFGMSVLIMFSFVAAKKVSPKEIKHSEKSENRVFLQNELPTAPVKQAQKIQDANSKTVKVYNPEGDVIALLSEIKQDTVPATKATPADEAAAVLHAKIARMARDTAVKESPFTNFSTNSNNENNVSTIVYEARTKEGKSYRLKKVNDVATEFAINGESIPQSQFEAHKAEMDMIETVYRDKVLRNKLRRLSQEEERVRVQEKQRAMRDMKRENNDHKRTEIEREQRIHEKIKRDTAYTKILEEHKKTIHEKEALFQKHEKLMNDQQKMHLKKYADTLKWTKEKEGEKTKWILQKYKLDSAERMVMAQVREEMHKRKEDQMRMRKEQDEVRFDQSATTMKNIVADLEKEGIKVDLQKSWFALDKDQFLVDGKKMSTELHEKFLAKYVKTNGSGWGYYYGPIQTRGRGVFLDYRDLVK